MPRPANEVGGIDPLGFLQFELQQVGKELLEARGLPLTNANLNAAVEAVVANPELGLATPTGNKIAADTGFLNQFRQETEAHGDRLPVPSTAQELLNNIPGIDDVQAVNQQGVPPAPSAQAGAQAAPPRSAAVSGAQAAPSQSPVSPLPQNLPSEPEVRVRRIDPTTPDVITPEEDFDWLGALLSGGAGAAIAYGLLPDRKPPQPQAGLPAVRQTAQAVQPAALPSPQPALTRKPSEGRVPQPRGDVINLGADDLGEIQLPPSGRAETIEQYNQQAVSDAQGRIDEQRLSNIVNNPQTTAARSKARIEQGRQKREELGLDLLGKGEQRVPEDVAQGIVSDPEGSTARSKARIQSGADVRQRIATGQTPQGFSPQTSEVIRLISEERPNLIAEAQRLDDGTEWVSVKTPDGASTWEFITDPRRAQPNEIGEALGNIIPRLRDRSNTLVDTVHNKLRRLRGLGMARQLGP